jgi:hypothetical protein
MAAKNTESSACKCGQVTFDLSGRKIGDVLTCPWCKKSYHYAGENHIVSAPDIVPDEMDGDEPKHSTRKLDPLDEDGEGVATETAEVEVIRATTSDKSAADPRRDTIRSHVEKRKQQKKAIVAAKEGEGGTGTSKVRRGARPKELPGGVKLMVTYIVLFNAATMIALWLAFPLQSNGTRLTPWGWVIPAYRVPFPELASLVLGHLLGFLFWAHHVYKLHKQQKAKAAEEAASAATRKAEPIAGSSKKAKLVSTKQDAKDAKDAEDAGEAEEDDEDDEEEESAEADGEDADDADDDEDDEDDEEEDIKDRARKDDTKKKKKASSDPDE